MVGQLLPRSTGLFNFLAMGNDGLLDIEYVNNFSPSVKVETEDSLVFLNALLLSFTGLVWICRI
jgi:hypothetical protein